MAANLRKILTTRVRPTLSLLQSLAYSVQTAAKNEVPYDSNFEDKVAVITGGGSGIGYEIAKEFLKGGMSFVTIVDSDKDGSSGNVKKLIDEYGEDNILFVEGDAGDPEQMDYAFRNTVLHYHTIDIIVNNAGVMNDVHWENQIKTNLHGCVIGTLLGMQYMSKSSSGKGGIIVNVGSTVSMVPLCGFPIYTLTQFGIAGFSKALGSSYLHNRTGVKVFGYCPGLTDTKLIKAASSRAINQNFAAEFHEEIEGCSIQRPEKVARGLIKILEKAKPGTIWVAENDADPYELNFPAAGSLRQKKANVQ